MTQALVNFVNGVADDHNQDARSALVGALGVSDKWVKEYVVQLTASGSPLLAQLGTLDLTTLDAFIRALFGNPTLKQELLKLLNQTPSPDWEADIIKLLAQDGSFIDAYIKTLTTDAATSGAPSKLATQLGLVAHDDPPGKLKSLVEALAANDDVLAGLGKTLGDKNHDALLTKLIGLVVGPLDQATITPEAVGTFLQDRPGVRKFVVNTKTLQALLLVLEQGGDAAKTKDLADLIKTSPSAKKLRQLLMIPEP